MYNRYIPNGASYTRIPMEDAWEPAEKPPQSGRQNTPTDGPSRRGTQTGRNPSGSFSLPPFLTGKGDMGGLSGLLKALNLEGLDSGDLLLLLIVLLLLLEGDNLELVIALGLVLILGLGDEEEEKS